MAVTTRHGVPTNAPSWKVVVMTCITVLLPIGLRLANRFAGQELMSDADITGLTGLVTFVGGWLAPPQGVT